MPQKFHHVNVLIKSYTDKTGTNLYRVHAQVILDAAIPTTQMVSSEIMSREAQNWQETLCDIMSQHGIFEQGEGPFRNSDNHDYICNHGEKFSMWFLQVNSLEDVEETPGNSTAANKHLC